MTITHEISTEHNNYPNLTVYDRFADGVPAGWRVNANEGYVFYDTNDENFELDENGNEVPVIYYYTVCYFPRTLDWNTFGLVAVLRSSVDENYIYGSGDDNHETM